MNSVERAQEIAMMTRPERWPAWPFLPLKNKQNYQTAILVQLEADRAVRPIVYLRNAFATKPALKDVPTQEFSNFNEILAAGWAVD